MRMRIKLHAGSKYKSQEDKAYIKAYTWDMRGFWDAIDPTVVNLFNSILPNVIYKDGISFNEFRTMDLYRSKQRN